MARKTKEPPSEQKGEKRRAWDTTYKRKFKNSSRRKSARVLTDSVSLELGRDIEVRYLLPDTLFISTPETIMDLVKKHVRLAVQRQAWIVASTVTIMLLLPLVTSEFQDRLGLSGPTWEGAFLVGFVLSLLWLLQSVYVRIRIWKREPDLLKDIENASRRKKKKATWTVG
jgi:hypothetical protein